MLIIPAIDLKSGSCVRLKQGRIADMTIYSDDPSETATRWIQQGAKRLHIVDLDGAFVGKPENKDAVSHILKAHPDVPAQLGGGIRDIQTIEDYIDIGLRWVIIGTQAVKEPAFVKDACRLFPDQIIVGVDAKDGWVATEGWANVSSISAVEIVKRFSGYGVSSVIYTDIGRDGMLSGLNVAGTAALARETECSVIASAGLKNLSDISELLSVEHEGVIGVITGRAIYEGTLNLKEAIIMTERR